MYTSFHIRNFRCFDDLKLDDLARVNLIAGKNNVGKTALLEALYIFLKAQNNDFDHEVNPLRGATKTRFDSGDQPSFPWNLLFKSSDTSHDIEISAKAINDDSRNLIIRFVHDPLETIKLRSQDNVRKARNTQYIIFGANGKSELLGSSPSPSPLSLIPVSMGSDPKINANRFSRLEMSGKQELLLNTLQTFEPRLRRLLLLYINERPVLSAEVEPKQVLPLPLMGEGLNRLANYVMAIVDSTNGVVLIDEIENGLHYSALEEVWKAIGYAAREFNTQVFATTHSLECIRAAHQAFSESDAYDFRYHRLDRDEKTGNISVETYDEKLIEASIQADFEVR